MILLFTPTSPVQEVSFIHPTTPRWRPPRWSLPPAGRPAGMMDSVLGVNLTTRTSWMDEGAGLVPLILDRADKQAKKRNNNMQIFCKSTIGHFCNAPLSRCQTFIFSCHVLH